MGNVRHRRCGEKRDIQLKRCEHSDFADQFPSAEVIGTDLSPIQPLFVSPNCKFEVDDACAEWTYAPNSFDFIHIRAMYGSVADWPAFYNEVFTYVSL